MKLTDIYVSYGRSETTGERYVSASSYEKGVRLDIKTVSGGKRFGHYLIDMVCFYILTFVAGVVVALTFPNVNLESSVVSYSITAAVIVLYYFVVESLLQSSLGKLVTRCVVIDEYGNKPTAGQLLGRSFARLIPFEAFSCLGDNSRGWHDSMSNTYVVQKEDLKWMLRLKEESQGVDSKAYDSFITS